MRLRRAEVTLEELRIGARDEGILPRVPSARCVQVLGPCSVPEELYFVSFLRQLSGTLPPLERQES